MGYYDDQRTMKIELQQLISTKKPGEKIKIANLILHYGTRFGFGKKSVLNALEMFAKDNKIFLYKDDFEVC